MAYLSCLGKSYPHFFQKGIPTFRVYCAYSFNKTGSMYLFVVSGGYLLICLLSWGSVSIEQTPSLLLNTPQRRLTVTDYQLPAPTFSSAYLDLTDEKNDLVNYFRSINLLCRLSSLR